MKNIKLAVIGVFTAVLVIFKLAGSDAAAGQAGGTQLAAPTGVTATDNLYNNKVGIYWDAVRGANLYRIFRNPVNDSATATAVGSTPSNSFFDLGGAPNQTFFYWVKAENGTLVSAFSSVDTGVRTGTPQQGPVPPLGPPPVPQGNDVTATKVYLGKALFWDEQMSSTRTVSCGTCHHAGNGGTDPRSTSASVPSFNPGPDSVFGTQDDVRGSAGVPANNLDGTYLFASPYGFSDQVTGRKSVSHMNAGYAPLLFWDGRASGTFRDPLTNNIVINAGAALESQVLGPPLSSAEMAHTGRDWNDVAARVAGSKPLALSPSVPSALKAWINDRTYPQLFEEAFGTGDVTPARIAMAIATFERTLFTDQTPLDMANAGITPLTAQENRGRNIFNASSCNVCHAGNLLTDQSFRYIGVRPQNDDTGRFQVTGNNNDRGSFRVPSLRNVEKRGSFFHNGQFTTLEQVVAFYNRGGDFNAPNKPNGLIRPLGLAPPQQADLVAFLKRPLTDIRVAAESGPFDRPTLYMESTRVPQITGTGRSGSGGIAPEIRAISPPLLGNPNFTVSLSRALGNAEALLFVDVVDPGVGTTLPTARPFARVSTTTQNTGAGNGWASVSLSIPDKAYMNGKVLYARWYVTDPAAASGFSVTPAAKFVLFGKDTRASESTALPRQTDDTSGADLEMAPDAPSSTDDLPVTADVEIQADVDGDDILDTAVFRDGLWNIARTRDGLTTVHFGMPGDVPQPADYDGDGITDLAVFRPSEGQWYVLDRAGAVRVFRSSPIPDLSSNMR